MGQSYDEIVERINDHLGKSGKRYYSDFYIGISKDAIKSLFEKHHVDKESSWWIYRTAVSAETARKVKKHYLDLGMRSGSGREDEDEKSNMVYCYVVTPTTTE